jgi:hypothetical protein
MKHVELFEDFLLEWESPKEYQKRQEKEEEERYQTASKKIAAIIKKSPKALLSVQYCDTLMTAMVGDGTDEAKIFSVFSKIKTKGEMIQIMAIWDMCDYNYDKAQGIFGSFAKSVKDFFTGGDTAYDKKVSGRLDKMGRWAKDTLNSLDFWNKADTRATDAYYKERAAWFKKNPTQQKTSLFYWLREELDSGELAKVNGMIKKFGMKISS